MSKYEWERGTFTLPSAEVAGLKAMLRDYANTLHEEVRTEAIRLHKHVAKSTRSASLYRERLSAHDQQQRATERNRATGWGYTSTASTADRKALVATMAREVLNRMLSGGWGQPDPTPHQPTVADVNKVIAKATNRTTSFPVIGRDGWGEASITFDGRTVIWDVPENNHAVERATEAEIATKFFNALSKITWTRSTGGATWGNDEYNESEHGHGRGPDYLGATYGPLGTTTQEDQYRRNGFTAKQAREMVAARNSPAPSRAYGW